MTSNIYNKKAVVDTTLPTTTSVTTPGTGFAVNDKIFFAPPDAGIAAIGNVDAISGPGAIMTVTLDGVNTGYTFLPRSVGFESENGKGPIQIDVTGTITLNFTTTTDILLNDIVITPEETTPGGGGILRLYMAFNFDTASNAIATVFRNGRSIGQLNADNGAVINDNGAYRFDISCEGGDNINLQVSAVVATVLDLRAHLVLFGA